MIKLKFPCPCGATSRLGQVIGGEQRVNQRGCFGSFSQGTDSSRTLPSQHGLSHPQMIRQLPKTQQKQATKYQCSQNTTELWYSTGCVVGQSWTVLSIVLF